MISLLTFRLAEGVQVAEFLEADSRMQADFSYQQRGLLRRTTASASQGGWLVLELWASEEAADAARRQEEGDPVARTFLALIDRATMSEARYRERD